MEKWFRFELYGSALRLELADTSPSFDAIISALHAPPNQTNKRQLTFGMAELSRLNILHSLHTLHYDNTAFMRMLDEASQKYPDSLEFPVAMAFAGIAFGQLYNGMSQLASLYKDMRMPIVYVDVLEYTVSNWVTNLPSFSGFVGHDIRDRAVKLQWTIPTTEQGLIDLVDELADDSLALMCLEPENQRVPNYGHFQSLRSYSIQNSESRLRLENIGNLVSDYWGPLGLSVLSVLRKVLAKRSTEDADAIEDLKLHGENMTAFIAASSKEVSLIGYCCLAEWNCAVSCLRWLIALLGKPNTGLQIRSCKPGDWKPKPIEGRLCRLLPGQFSETLYQMRYVLGAKKISKYSRLCWVKLFSDAYIGSHIPGYFTYRPGLEEQELWKGKGLKVSFDVLIHAAGVRKVFKVDGTPILCGFTTALVPIGRFDDGSVQWHLIVAEDNDGPFRLIQHRPDFQSLLPSQRLRNIELDDLRSTAYVGWHKDGVHITFGTLDPPAQISRSYLPIHEEIKISADLLIQLGIQSTLSPVGGLFSITKTYRRRGLAFAMAAPENFCGIIDRLFSKHVIVYDDTKKLAVLLPLINLVLFLVRAYCRDNGYSINHLLPETADGRPLRRDEIRRLGTEFLYDGFSFADAVNIVVDRYSEVHHFLPSELRLTESAMLGFEVADILGNNDTFYPRKLSVGKGVRAWKPIAKTTDVVFGADLGEFLKVSSTGQNAPRCDREPPTGFNILVFPIPLLKSCFDYVDGNCLGQRGRKDLRWEPTASIFNCGLGSQCDGQSCFRRRLQCIKKGTGVLKRRDVKINGNVTQKYTWLDGDGAVCFGDLI